jgi:pyruvate dehydrogenase E2 component (dihydrolipoamide acetyltransferase)
VNQLIAVLAQEGEDPKAAASAAGKGAAPVAKSTPVKSAAPAATPAPPVAKAEPAAKSAPAPAAPAGAPSHDATSHDATSHGATSHGANRIFASPLARRLAKSTGIELNRIRGSGPHGRIIARDVEAARSGQGLAPAAASSFALPVPSDDKIRALFEPGSYDVVPHDNIRKVIARRLVEAKLTIPHFYLTLDCNIGKLLAAREEINGAAPKDKDGKPAYKLSVNDFVIKALALALQRVPDANVTWTEGGMLRHHRSDIGVAVSIPGGLITPVVRHAEAKSLSTISNEMKDFAARARARKL